jgi:hypothetical protein
MLSSLVTSRGNVSIPFSSRLDRDLVDRAVANTRRPWAANSRARSWPTPPGEHLDSIKMVVSLSTYLGRRWSRVKRDTWISTNPVMRIDRFDDVGILLNLCAERAGV